MRHYGAKRVNPAQAAAQNHFTRQALSVERRADLTRGDLTLTIAEATPSPNEINGHHWSYLDKLRTRWRGLVLEALSRQRAIGFYPGRRKATLAITRVGKGILDHDNFVGGLKIPVDQLRHLGLIVDDAAEWLEWGIMLQRKCTKGELPSTTVRIEWEAI